MIFKVTHKGQFTPSETKREGENSFSPMFLCKIAIEIAQTNFRPIILSRSLSVNMTKT